MLDRGFFQKALKLEEPWYVDEIVFNEEKEQLEVHVDFTSGSKFPCPNCGHPYVLGLLSPP